MAPPAAYNGSIVRRTSVLLMLVSIGGANKDRYPEASQLYNEYVLLAINADFGRKEMTILIG